MLSMNGIRGTHHLKYIKSIAGSVRFNFKRSSSFNMESYVGIGWFC